MTFPDSLGWERFAVSYAGATHEQDGHTRLLDLEFYGKLKQPLARLLYRTLEEQRMIGQTEIYTVSLLTWAEHLGLRELDPSQVESKEEIPATRVLRADKIRRALEPAHNNLKALGYLTSVNYMGRGSAQTISYTFAPGVDVTPRLDPELVALLTTRGVTLGRAQEFARVYKPEDIRAAVGRFDARLEAGYRPRTRGGLMVDVLTKPERYAVVQDEPMPVLLPSNAPSRAQEPREAPSENSVPSRTVAAAEAVLLAVLRSSEADRTLRAQVIDRFVSGHGTIMDLVTLSRMTERDAREAAQALISNT